MVAQGREGVTLKRKTKKPKRSSLTRKADALASKVVRARGYCQMKLGLDTPCGGDWQCCHVIGRRYRSTRWDERNLLCGCRDHHVYWTHRPEGFVLAIQREHPGLYEELWSRAQQTWDKQYPISALEESLSALNLSALSQET
jgi:hypothetical protein